MTEIKEIKEKTQKVDDVVLAITSGSRHPIIPNLEFEYSDSDIHKDLYKLIKYSCEEICTTKEQLNKVMRLWTTFMEPILGIPSWPCNSEVTEDVGRARHQTGRRTNSNIGEGDGSPVADASTLNYKQSEPLRDGDESKLPEQANSCKIGLANEDTSAKDDGFHLGKGRKILAVVDTVSRFDITVGSVERLTNSNEALATAADNIQGIINMELTSGLCIRITQS